MLLEDDRNTKTPLIHRPETRIWGGGIIPPPHICIVPRRLFVVGAEQEGHDLSTGAVIIGTEQPAADAGGDAVCCSPCHRIRIVCVFGNIAELRCTLCPGT